MLFSQLQRPLAILIVVKLVELLVIVMLLASIAFVITFVIVVAVVFRTVTTKRRFTITLYNFAYFVKFNTHLFLKIFLPL